MLTLFTVPKPFRAHTAIIQRNAIRSWTRLGTGVEIILFGREDGDAQAAAEFGVHHYPEIRRNEFGTPLLSDVFATAERVAANDLLCFINTDLLLLSDFSPAVATVAALRHGFLLVGRRTNLPVASDLALEGDWEQRLRSDAVARGVLDSPWAVDYFVFRRGAFPAVPPFAVGRAAYDNWLLYEATRRGATVIDATAQVLAIHQAHDYSHIPNWPGAWVDPESDRNRAIAGGFAHMFSLDDATHVLDEGRVRHRPMAPKRWRRSLEVHAATGRAWSGLVRLALWAVDASHPLRARLRLVANPHRRPSDERPP